MQDDTNGDRKYDSFGSCSRNRMHVEWGNINDILDKVANIYSSKTL